MTPEYGYAKGNPYGGGNGGGFGTGFGFALGAILGATALGVIGKTSQDILGRKKKRKRRYRLI